MNSNSRVILVGESFSPWTQKARWALEQCNVSFDYREYVPTLSEPWLRWRMRQWSGMVSVPVLLDGRQVIRGSWAIAQFAAWRVGDTRLGDLKAVAPWDELSEAALAEARTRVLRAVMADPAALDEASAALVGRQFRRPLRLLARAAAERLDRKYRHLAQRGALYRALETTRHGLEVAGCDYLLGAFSYADITMVVVLEGIAPFASTTPPLGPATRMCWTDARLADEFSDLLEWRIRLARTAHASAQLKRGLVISEFVDASDCDGSTRLQRDMVSL